MPKVLLVEDEKAISDLIVDYLEAQNYLVDLVTNGEDAANRMQFFPYDLVILDWNLPGKEGVDVCKGYRAGGGKTPVIMLTCKRDLDSKEAGFDAGADDYLTKPFQMRELGFRVKALLRRSQDVQASALKVRDVTLDTESRRVLKGEAEVELLPKEFALLEFLMKNPNRVFSPEALIDRVWSSDSEASASVIRSYIQRLRSKLDTKGETSLIGTVHGVGYRLDP
jgi:DNA-binding response OmpR family regulator